MLGYMIAAHAYPPTQGVTGNADYVVTTKAEWDAVFANSASNLANKIVEVAAPLPSAVAINNKDFVAAGGPVTIRSRTAADFLGHLDLFTLVRGVNFSGVSFQLQGWPKAHTACIEFGTGTFGALRFINGTSFRHGYGPSLANFDTAANLPEYDRVNNVRTATTTSATHALTWKDPAATSGIIQFFNRGANSVRVAVGNSGVVATGSSQLVAAGATFRFSSLNPTTTTHFAVLSTTGTSEVNARAEIGLGFYLGRALFAGGGAAVEGIEIRNCLFRDVADGVKGIGTPQSVVVMDNDFDRIYADIIAAAPAVGGKARIMRNISSIAFCRSGIAENLSGDAGDPHGDVYQTFGIGAGTISNIQIAGNRMRATALRPGVINQGVFISDNDTSPSYRDVAIISDMFVGGSAAQIAAGEGSAYPIRDMMIYGASIVDYSNAANGTPRIAIDTDEGGSIYIGKSISPNFVFNLQPPQQDGNVRWNGVANPAAIFPNLGDLATASSRAQIEAAMTTAAEGTGIGAVATADAINWTASDPEAVIRWENVPSGAHWNGLTQQAVGTPITLPLRKILNKRANQTVTVGAGTAWRSVDVDGTTQVQAWTTSPGTIQPGQFVQIRRTSSAEPGGLVAASVTINGFTQSVSITTSIEPVQYLIQGADAGFFVDPANVPAGTNRITFRAKIRLPAAFPTMNLFTQESTGCDLQLFNLSNTATGNATVEDTAGSKMLSNVQVITSAMAMPAGTWCEVEFDVDHVARVVRATVNGVTNTVPFTASGTGSFTDFREVSFLANTAGALPVPNGTFIADVSVDFNGVRHKTIPNDGAAANADAWKRGTGIFTNG